MKYVKKIFLMVIYVVFPIISQANGFEVNGIAYEYISTIDHTVSVTYKAQTYGDGIGRYEGHVVIPSHVTFLGVEYTVCAISYGAFGNCAELLSVDIPNTVTAFISYLHNGSSCMLSAFNACPKLEKITIPASVTTIGPDCFRDCTSLKEVIFEDSNENIIIKGLSQFAGDWKGGKLFENCPIEKVYVGRNFVDAQSLFGNSELKEVEFGQYVKRIPQKAFMGSTSLEKIILPNRIEEIGDSAFMNCQKLNEVQLPRGIDKINQKVFANCSSLTKLTIPDGVTSISAYAFHRCAAMSSINIPQFCTNISSSAFVGCHKLQNFIVDENNTAYDVEGPILTNKQKNTVLAYPSAKGELDLVSQYFMRFSAIGQDAFAESEVEGICLSGVFTEQSVQRIGVRAFRDCQKLCYVYFEGASIESQAFQGCSNLPDFYIYPETEYIGSEAFKGCYALKKLTIGKGDGGLALSPLAFKNSGLEKVTIGRNGIQMADIESLKEACLLEGVLIICNKMFSGCVNLEKVQIPHSVTSIEPNAFKDCRSLRNITIPNSVVSLGDGFLSGCSALQYIHSEITVPPVLQNSSFTDVDKERCRLIVPNESVETYKKTPGWLTFFQIISPEACINRPVTLSCTAGGKTKVGNREFNDKTDNENWNVSSIEDIIVDITPATKETVFQLTINNRIVYEGHTSIKYTVEQSEEELFIDVQYTIPQIDVSEVCFAEKELTLEIGDRTMLEVSVAPDNATNKSIIWSSSNEDVAMISSSGTVVAMSEGKAVITATSESNPSVCASIEITVIPVLAKSIGLNYTSYSLGKNETLQLEATVLPENTGNKKVVWASSNEDVVMVSSSGKCIYMGEGTANITATTTDGSNLSAACTFSCSTGIVSITINNNSSRTFNIKGQEQSTHQRGVYISIDNDGNVRKYLTK